MTYGLIAALSTYFLVELASKDNQKIKHIVCEINMLSQNRYSIIFKIFIKCKKLFKCILGNI